MVYEVAQASLYTGGHIEKAFEKPPRILLELWERLKETNFTYPPVHFEKLIDFTDYWLKYNAYLPQRSTWKRLPCTLDKYMGWHELIIYFKSGTIEFKPLPYTRKTKITLPTGESFLVNGFPYEFEYYTLMEVPLYAIDKIEYSKKIIDKGRVYGLERACSEYGLKCMRATGDARGLRNRLLLETLRLIVEPVLARTILVGEDGGEKPLYRGNLTDVFLAWLWDNMHGFAGIESIRVELVIYKYAILQRLGEMKKLVEREQRLLETFYGLSLGEGDVEDIVGDAERYLEEILS